MLVHVDALFNDLGEYQIAEWQDGSGNTWLSYNDPGWLANRHGFGHDVDATVTALTAALDVLARAATLNLRSGYIIWIIPVRVISLSKEIDEVFHDPRLQ